MKFFGKGMYVACYVAREVAICELVTKVELTCTFVHVAFNNIPCFGLDGEGYAFFAMLHVTCLESNVINLICIPEIVLNHIDEVHSGKVIREAEHITGNYELVAGWCAVAYALELLNGDVKFSLGCLLNLDIDEWLKVVLYTVHLDATVDDGACA